MLLPENPHALLEIRNFDLQDCYEEKVARDTKWVATNESFADTK